MPPVYPWLNRLVFKDHFSDRAPGYASNRPVYPPELVEYLAAQFPDVHPLTAWDAGCGSGQLSVPLAARFDRVIATDASAEQIAHATAHPRVEYRAAPAENSGIAAESVDLAVAAQAAHWFDLPRFYREVRRVVRTGGVVALVTYDLLEVNDDIDARVQTFYRSLDWPPERRLVENGYASLSFPFHEMQAPRLFIRAHWIVEQLLGYVDTWSGVRGVDTAPFERDIRKAWGEASRAVCWPIAMRIGRIE